MKVDKKTFKAIFSFSISLCLSGLLVRSLYLEGFESLIDKIDAINLKLLSIYVLLSLFGLFLRAYRYRLVFSSFLPSTPSLGKMLITTGVRNGFVDFLPARLGELSFFYILKKYNISTSAITTVFGLCTAIDIVVLLFIVFVACFFSFDENLLSIKFAPIFLLLSVFIFLVLKNLDHFLNFFKKWEKENKIVKFFNSIADHLLTIKNSNKYAQILFVTLLLRLAKYGSLYILLISVVEQFGFNFDELNPLITSISFICAEASASLPISGIMGFGAYEGIWEIVFKQSSVKIPSLSSVIFLVHIISQVVGYFIAIICLLSFSISLTSLNKS